MQGDLSAEEQRGREIVEAEAHCGECHTPRGLLGATKRGAAWLTGAPNPEGGHFPDLTPPKMAWSADDLMQYFTTGFTPNFDMVGGQMALVVDDLNQLPESDLKAVIAYLKRLPLGD
jgi:mono/diheme cytochrome c family protein